MVLHLLLIAPIEGGAQGMRGGGRSCYGGCEQRRLEEGADAYMRGRAVSKR